MARRLRRHLVVPLVMALLLAGIATGSYVALQRYGSPAHEGACTATGLGTSPRYTTDRRAHAWLISALAVRRQRPPRAASSAPGPADAGTCAGTGLGTSPRYTTDRVAHAALLSALAVDRKLPPRAASIALATAYQESQLRNLGHGDRDSLGLFQQRPSQGWGSEE